MRELDAKHWVIKIGSSVLIRDDHRSIDRPTFASLIEGIDALLTQGKRVTVISSGAVALGRQRTGIERRDIPHLQALAALGQSRLMQMWEGELAHYDRLAAQLLLSRADLDDRGRYLNARMALQVVHDIGAVPVINENDSVATEELRFGDNDELAAMTCGLLQAQLLVLLSDVEGLFDVEGQGASRRLTTRIPEISVDDPRLDRLAGPSISGVGRGGMISKVAAARLAARTGARTIIAPGKHHGVLRQLAQGHDVGTLFTVDDEAQLLGRKVWIGAGARAVGQLHVDAGAKRAVIERGASLLPIGLVRVEGQFSEGAVVEIVDPEGQAFARGLSVYSAEASRLLVGVRSEHIEEVLGFTILDAVVHRDSMVVF